MSLSTRPAPRRINLVIAAVLVIAAMIGAAFAAVYLTHQIPSANIPAATVSSPCNALATTSSVTANSGAIQYTCPSATAAFTTLAGSSTYTLTGYTPCPGSVTTPCYTNFGYVTHGSTICKAGAPINATWFNPIYGVTPPTLTFVAGSWDYCAFYGASSTGGTLPGFSIGWS